MTKLKSNMPTAIKVAKAIHMLRKHNYISVQLFRNKLEEQDLKPSIEKLYAMWNHMVDNHTIRKVSRKEYHWNGSLAIWDDVDKANAYCLNLLKVPSKKVKRDQQVIQENPLQIYNDKILVEELRSRGWQITASRQVTVTEEL